MASYKRWVFSNLLVLLVLAFGICLDLSSGLGFSESHGHHHCSHGHNHRDHHHDHHHHHHHTKESLLESKLPEELAEEEDMRLYGFGFVDHDHDHDHKHEHFGVSELSGLGNSFNGVELFHIVIESYEISIKSLHCVSL